MSTTHFSIFSDDRLAAKALRKFLGSQSPGLFRDAIEALAEKHNLNLEALKRGEIIQLEPETQEHANVA